MQAKILMLIALLAMGICGLLALNDMEIIAQINGEHHDSGFGSSMVSLDFNHDGYDDLVVCAAFYGYCYSPNTPSRGKVYVYYGGPDFSADTPPAMTLEGTYNGTSGLKVREVTNIGDVNGDGYPDLCIPIGDPNYVEETQLQIFYGSCIDLSTPDRVIAIPGQCFFTGFTALGDVNGDGFGDMGLDYNYLGIKYLMIVWGDTFSQDTVSEGEGSYSYVSSMQGIGDINNDGFADFATGFVVHESSPSIRKIRIYCGNPASNLSNPVSLIRTDDTINIPSKPLEDFNNDGYDDFMGYVSSSGMNVWLGGHYISFTTPDLNLSPAWYGGSSVRALVYGDFNNDGYSDVIGADNVEKKFSLWLGRHNVNGTSDFIYHRPGSTNFGYTLAAGDYNADGYDDLAVSAPFENDPPPQGTFYGFVWIHAGNAELEDTFPPNDDPIVPPLPEGVELRLTPNPVYRYQGFVTAQISGSKLPESAPGTAEVFNIRGQKVFSTSFQVQTQSGSATLPVTDLPAGVYTCRVTVAGSSTVQRFTRLP